MNATKLSKKLLLMFCSCLLFCLLTTSTFAQAENNMTTVSITIEMTDAEGNTTVKKIVETSEEEMSQADIQALIDEEIGDFEGNVNVNVSVNSSNVEHSEEAGDEEVEVTVDEEGNVFINGEPVDPNDENVNVIILESSDEGGLGEVQDMLIEMDVDVDLEELIENAEGEEAEIRIVKKIITSEENSNGGFLGIITESNPASTGGAKLTYVGDNTPASKAGLQLDDVIKAIDGEPINSHQDLIDAMGKYEAGQTIRVGFARGNEAMSQDIVLGERPAEQKVRIRKHDLGNGNKWISKEDAFMRGMDMSKCTKPCEEMTEEECQKICGMSKEECMKKCEAVCGEKKSSKPRLGVTIEDRDDAKGVFVDDVNRNSPADKAGIKSGDVITKINKTKVRSTRELIDAIGQHQVGDEINVQYLRYGKKKKANVTLEAAPVRRMRGRSGGCQPMGSNKEEIIEKKMIILKMDEEGNVTEEIVEGPTFNIDNTLDIKTLDLYPNPTEGNINVKFEAKDKVATNVKILNVAGKVIFSKNSLTL